MFEEQLLNEVITEELKKHNENVESLKFKGKTKEIVKIVVLHLLFAIIFLFTVFIPIILIITCCKSAFGMKNVKYIAKLAKKNPDKFISDIIAEELAK